MGTSVGVSVDVLCVGASVGRGVKVCDAVAEAVRVGIRVKVSEGGMPVEVSAAAGEGGAVGFPLLKLQAKLVAIIGIMK